MSSAGPATSAIHKRQRKGRQLRFLYRLEAWLEAPMFLLALAWAWLFVVELSRGLSTQQQGWVTAIWICFIAEFLLKLIVAPRRLSYLRKNKLTLLALFIPAFRTIRLLRALRLLRSARVVTTTRFVRAFTSSRRLLTDLREAQGSRPNREMNVGVLVAIGTSADKQQILNFARQLATDARPVMEAASGIAWRFHCDRTLRLDSDAPQRPSAFLDEASRYMAEGPFDLVLVVTDAVLISRRKLVQPGLASPVSRTLIVSADSFTKTPRDRSPRRLESDTVRWNAASLLLHMLGHIGGLKHVHKTRSEVMAPFVFRELRHGPAEFNQREKALLRRRAEQLPERELRSGGALGTLIFHILMMARHPGDVFLPLLRSRPVLLPFALPSLSTAAVAPALLLIFSAEIWDVGFNMNNLAATAFALASIIGASFYLIKIQSLFFPRKEKQTVTEHLAIANGVVFLSILLACIGLFLLVGGLVLLIQFYVFPEDLMRTWPTLDSPEISLADQLRLAAFISTIGVTTGALAGGMESRGLIQQLALFEELP